MKTASAAKGHEREVARVVSALNGDGAKRALHLHAHHAQDALRGLYHTYGAMGGAAQLFAQTL